MRFSLSLTGLLIAALASSLVAAAVPPERTLFSESFDGLQAEGCPPGWLPLEGEWFLAQRASGVLRQGNTDLTRESWALALWQNYTVVTKFLADDDDGNWGVGVIGYMSARGSGYRLRASEGKLYLDKLCDGRARALTSTEAKITRGKWISLRLTLSNEGHAAVLQGKAWSGEGDEPANWTLQFRDESETLPGGTVGLWTGDAAARFAYVTARRPDAGADKPGDILYRTDFSEVDPGQLPAFWRTNGGLWLRDTLDKLPVLRQMLPRSGADFEDNASALLGWSGYTVSAKAIAHPGPGKWGLGLVACYGSGGSNYRLRALDNRLYLVKQVEGGRVQTLAVVNADLKRGRWYDLKLAVENLRSATLLSGKLWNDEDNEPEAWQITAADQNAPLRFGAPGLWCFGGAADFDNFLVRTTVLSSLNASLP